jgi:uncharacterized membrane protein
VKPFLLYTLARVALFAAAFGLIWVVFGHWLEWSTVSALYTAVIAMVVSSVVALLVLGSLRDDFAVQVSQRADRAKAAYEARRAAEDVDSQNDDRSDPQPDGR